MADDKHQTAVSVFEALTDEPLGHSMQVMDLVSENSDFSRLGKPEVGGECLKIEKEKSWFLQKLVSPLSKSFLLCGKLGEGIRMHQGIPF